MNEKQKLDRDLEEVFHMNAKMKEIESKMTFNEPKNSFKFNKVAFALSTCAACLVLIGASVGSFFLGKNEFNEHEDITVVLEDKMKEAFDYIDTICNKKDKAPYRSFLINNEMSLYFYRGTIDNSTNYEKCYFYQFVFYKDSDYELNLKLKNEDNIVFSVNLAEYNYLGRIEKEGFNFTNSLELILTDYGDEILHENINL